MRPARLGVRFEFGPSKWRQAPDAASVALYWRDGGLMDTRHVTLRSVSAAGADALVVVVRGMTAAELQRFVGGTLAPSPASTGGGPPPAADRRRLRITGIEGTNRLRLQRAR